VQVLGENGLHEHARFIQSEGRSVHWQEGRRQPIVPSRKPEPGWK
jgi:hypothetical protein